MADPYREPMPRMYTTQAAAELFGVKPETIRNWISSGKLAGKKIGKRTFIPEAALRELLSDKYDL